MIYDGGDSYHPNTETAVCQRFTVGLERWQFLQTLREIRTYPERHHGDRCRTVPGREP